jgi:hypothetical protein
MCACSVLLRKSASPHRLHTKVRLRLASYLIQTTTPTVVLRNVNSRSTVNAARGSRTARASSRHKAEDKDEESSSSNPFSTLSEAISGHKSSQERQSRVSAVRSDGKAAVNGCSCTSPPPPATSCGACGSAIRTAFSSMHNAARIHNRGDGNSNTAASAAGGGSRR